MTPQQQQQPNSITLQGSCCRIQKDDDAGNLWWAFESEFALNLCNNPHNQRPAKSSAVLCYLVIFRRIIGLSTHKQTTVTLTTINRPTPVHRMICLHQHWIMDDVCLFYHKSDMAPIWIKIQEQSNGSKWIRILHTHNTCCPNKGFVFGARKFFLTPLACAIESRFAQPHDSCLKTLITSLGSGGVGVYALGVEEQTNKRLDERQRTLLVKHIIIG